MGPMEVELATVLVELADNSDDSELIGVDVVVSGSTPCMHRLAQATI